MSRSFILSSAILALRASAQLTASVYTDEKTGITFNGFQHSSGYKLGYALPETLTSDLIAQLVAPITNDGGWAGFPLGQSMVGSVLVTAWPHGGEVISSFRKATGYTNPPVVTGDFSMTTIPEGTWVNDTAFSYTFLCKNCIGDTAAEGIVLSDTTNVFSWAYSDTPLTDPSTASAVLNMHNGGYGSFGFTVSDAQSADFATWAAMATGSAGGSGNSTGNSTTPIGGGGSSNSTTPTNNTATISDSTYDYIVCGAGPAGIIAAERIAESGASVLLLERGGPSLAFTGNNDTLSWNSSVSMYDVPGLDYYLNQVGTNKLCTDTADQAGCLLGGGTMVNAMMFVKPQSRDFDDKWPAGWKWSDVSASADRLYERNPGQNYGSEDGTRYNDEAYGVLSKFLGSNGFTETDLIDGDNNARQNVYGHPPWDLKNGMRAGPVRNYLPEAQKLDNFKLMLNTKVVRAVRNGTTISGVETETEDGKRVIYNINAGGKVVLSAGAMSTPRILFNSGIGPAEQLQTVASGSSGVTLPTESEWIDLPVGAEIKDHVIFTLKFKTSEPMSSVATTDITSPNQTVIDQFAKASGILAQSGQRLNFWTSVNTTSGSEMFIQGTCNGPANNTIQMKIYLTHGLTSVGSLGITSDGATELTSEPWLQTAEDKEAITSFMNRLLKMTSAPNSTLSFLSAGSTTGTNVTGADLIKEHVTGSHWVGTAKMGTKGDAGVVVDANTLVYGTDNLFVVDASIHADLPTGNTQATVMVVAEHAVAKILALDGAAPAPGNGTASSSSAPATPASSIVASAPAASVPVSGYATSNPEPTTSGAASAPASIAFSSAVAISTRSPSAPASKPTSASAPGSASAATPTAGGGASSGTVQLYGQCGGKTYTGATQCAQGTCVKMNDWYSQCVNA
ncbi:FAD/NAD(P)-binding domain-containing protein [Paraphaeosphaeria sporulosa]|uniref:FAD/NAD(P)-binding domain-containing protein n=1 Tax=Paraphaeosphaeria sporulosa TaxID=1460663 RepID=A0A177CWJ2_9PLEO|nr:FAD/NAD(P)-binding domain-containing protein [Paraphaeosphaeria sporulosa]OAG11596.1 FAD/NAD(P)-binding domain-containing protein [Paraphaeosphaeria sporulosa]